QVLQEVRHLHLVDVVRIAVGLTPRKAARFELSGIDDVMISERNDAHASVTKANRSRERNGIGWETIAMWPVSAIVYWSSLGLIGYAYLGYPVLIRALAAVRARPSRTGDLEPTVSVVMAVRNEALHIEPKLQNLLSLDYPAEKLEIIVVDDGSTDDTERVIGAFRD